MRHSPAPLVVALLVASAAFGAVTRGPYLQNVDQDSATVAFRLDGACPAAVRYGVGTDLSQSAASAASGTEHFVKLEGLTPGTQYAFSVEACGTATQKQGSFNTAPPAGASTVHFAVSGDMGTGGSFQKQVAQAMEQVDFEFWLALGDTAYESGTDQEFQARFFEPLAGVLDDAPFFAVIGNHEYLTNQGQPFFANFDTPANNPAKKEHYFSFDWGSVHVVGLDSNVDMEEQKAWLQQDLAKSTATWKVVMLHHPPYSSGDHGSSARAQALVPIFEAGGVDLVLAGHDHDYERSYPLKGGEVVPAGTPGAITYLVVGNGGATLRPFAQVQPPWSAYRNDTDYGFLDVKVDGGKLVGTLLGANGQRVDSFTLTKPVPPPTLEVYAEPAQGQAPMTVSFTAAPNPPDASISWDFGDGQSGTGPTVSHAFSQPGTYTVTATATSGGQSATHQTTVTANTSGTVADAEPPPATSPTPGPGPGLPGGEQGGEATPPWDDSAEGGAGCTAVGGFAPVLAAAGLWWGLGAVRRRRRQSGGG